VKKTYKQYLETGKLFTLPAAKTSELPAAAQQQLNKDNYGHNPRVSTAYTLLVKNQPAFVIHNRQDGRSLTAHIFNAYGQLIALGRAGTTTPLYWVALSSSYSGSDSSDYPSYGGSPDEVNDGTGGQGPADGGPDGTDWDGCGGSGSGDSDGPDGTGDGI
jgi:hypothetical protein